MNTTLSNIRIVLIGTQHPGNIGSAARAMKTMGLRSLQLVHPERFPDPDASMLAAGADDVLVMARLRRLYLRAGLDTREVRILRGILSEAQRMARLAGGRQA